MAGGAKSRKAHSTNSTTAGGKSSKNKQNGTGSLQANKNCSADISPSKSLSSYAWRLLVFSTFVVLWVGHSAYLHHLFENVRFFSHLADFEREMTYRTEMGLYFSYYKTMVNSPTFYDGLHEIMSDNVTEYGHTINTLHRFNLYPEVFLAGAYRLFKWIAASQNWQTELCWQVNRADDLPPVQSCEGSGNMHYFYINGVFGLAGSVLSSIFLLGVILSGSFFGGILSAAAFAFNHGEATRVAWTPPLRESFAYPIFIAQITIISYILKNNSSRRLPFIALTFLTTLFILVWQFSQFVLATQLGAIFVAFLLDGVTPRLLFSLWKSFGVAFMISLILLFGNPMLLNSLLSNSLVAYVVILLLEKNFRNYLKFRLFYISFLANIYLACVFGGKLAISRLLDIRDDNHVMEILRAKFSPDFATFHTRLYTCALEFDFIGFEWITKLSQTFLLPAVCASILILLVHFYRYELFSKNFWWRIVDSQPSKPTIPTTQDRISAEVIYNVVQTLCFVIMAGLIMRLKLFATPHLCVLSSLIASKKLLLSTFGSFVTKWRLVFVFALLAGMALQGRQNVTEQLEMRGEYNNPDQEHLFEWIIHSTPKTAIFAGSMPLMANVKLSTLRPIVNHPHYENEEVRNRTLLVYSMYSRKPIAEVHRTLRSLGVEFFVFQQSSCVEGHTDPRCTYLAMWDLEDPTNRGEPPLCNYIVDAATKDSKALVIISPFFDIVYLSRAYVVLRLKDGKS